MSGGGGFRELCFGDGKSSMRTRRALLSSKLASCNYMQIVRFDKIYYHHCRADLLREVAVVMLLKDTHAEKRVLVHDLFG
jgi:hypothetical protein